MKATKLLSYLRPSPEQTPNKTRWTILPLRQAPVNNRPSPGNRDQNNRLRRTPHPGGPAAAGFLLPAAPLGGGPGYW